jgi:hypothetical protein
MQISTVADLTKWAKLVGTGALITPELQAERLKWDRLGDNDDNWHYTFGLEENSGWIGHNGQIPGYFTSEVYNPELDATIVIAMNSDKKVNGEQGINVLLRACARTRFVNDAIDVECTDDELIVALVDGRRVSAPSAWLPRLLRATPKQRANWRLIGRGVGIHWEDVDEDISVRTLLAS